MKKLFTTMLCLSSLVVLAQVAPKAVLLEVNTKTASVVATLEGKVWKPTTETITPSTKAFLEVSSSLKLFTDIGQIGTATLQGGFKDANCGSASAFRSTTPLSRNIYALAAPWNIMPRKIQRLPLNNAAYIKVMAEELAKRGIKAPVQMTQILKTDLDGDKSDEIILVAQRPALTADFDYVGTGYALKAHDYALTIIRKLTPNGVKTFVLREGFVKTDFDSKAYAENSTNPPFRFAQWVNGIADFDGNGTMEVLVNSVLWEGYGFEVNTWNGKGFSKMLEWGC